MDSIIKTLFTNPDAYFEDILFNDVQKDIDNLLKKHKLNITNFTLDHNLFGSIEKIRQHTYYHWCLQVNAMHLLKIQS